MQKVKFMQGVLYTFLTRYVCYNDGCHLSKYTTNPPLGLSPYIKWTATDQWIRFHATHWQKLANSFSKDVFLLLLTRLDGRNSIEQVTCRIYYSTTNYTIIGKQTLNASGCAIFYRKNRFPRFVFSNVLHRIQKICDGRTIVHCVPGLPLPHLFLHTALICPLIIWHGIRLPMSKFVLINHWWRNLLVLLKFLMKFLMVLILSVWVILHVPFLTTRHICVM